MSKTTRSTYVMPLDLAGAAGQSALVTMDDVTADILDLDVWVAGARDDDAIISQWSAASPRLRSRRDAQRDLGL